MGISYNNRKRISHINNNKWFLKTSLNRVSNVSTRQGQTLKTLTRKNRQFLISLGLKLRHHSKNQKKH